MVTVDVKSEKAKSLVEYVNKLYENDKNLQIEYDDVSDIEEYEHSYEIWINGRHTISTSKVNFDNYFNSINSK